MENIDLYSTHLEYLSYIFDVKGKLKNIVEFGMGNFSTKLLIQNGENVTSIEMQSEDWYENMKKKFSQNENWKHYKSIGPFTYTSISFPDHIDMAFVDGHGDSRPECINFMMERGCPIIISHDTEEPGYRWNLVKNNQNYKKIQFTKYVNWTTVWTTDDVVYNYLLVKNQTINNFII